MPFLSGSLGADDGQGALLLQQEFVEVRNPLWGSQVTQVPGDTRPKESGTSQGHGMISQSSSLMGSNTPRLRVQAGGGHRGNSTRPQGAAPKKPPHPPAPSVSPESQEMRLGDGSSLWHEEKTQSSENKRLK